MSPISFHNTSKHFLDIAAMLKRKLRSLRNIGYSCFNDLALDIGLYGHSDYTRFVILGGSRTGSNFLISTLKSHSQINTFGEIFSCYDAIKGWDNTGYHQSRTNLSLIQNSPVRFLENRIFKRYPKHISAVGFKIFYYHAQGEKWKNVWTYLKDQEELRIIHLKRKNKLKTYLSLMMATKTGRWKATESPKEENVSISLDYEDCLQVIKRIQEWEEKYDTFFSNNWKIDVFYEDLCRDFNGETKRIQEFLGVECEALKPSTYKQFTQPLSIAISNYLDLKRKFQGTTWEDFFEE